MASDSATALATQQSIKAYVLANVNTGSFLPLSGGTLTGGLSGTTASFSSTLSSGATTISGVGTSSSAYALRVYNGAGTPDDLLSIKDDGTIIMGGPSTVQVTKGLGLYVTYNLGVSGLIYKTGGADVEVSGSLRINSGGLKIGTQEVITSGRNLTNIGTIASGAITATSIDTTAQSDFGETISVDSSGYAILDKGSLGWAYSPQESGVGTVRYFLLFNNTNNGSYPYLTNRTPNGRVSIYAGSTAGGAENEKIRVNGGDGTTEIDMFGTLDLNANNIIGASTISSGAITSTGTITASGGNSGNWNTAYTVANAALPKAGGTMSGTLAMGANAITSTGTISSGAITSTGNIETTLDITSSGIITAGDSSTSGSVRVYHNDGTYLDHNGWGLEFARNFSYLRPNNDNARTMYFGASSQRWAQIQIHTPSLAMGTVQIMDASRNLTSIGTIACGEITTGAGTSGALVITDNYGASDHLANIGWLRSSGGTYLGYGAKQSGSATWVSTYDNISGKRNYVAFDEDSVTMVFAPAQQTAVGSAITGLTERFKFDLNNGVFQVNGTTVIDASRNISAGTISSGAITSSGDISIPVAKKLYFGGSSHTYISEDINDRLRFFVGGAEFMRFTESTADTTNIYTNLDVTGRILLNGGAGGGALLDIDGAISGDWAGRFENTSADGLGALVLIPSASASVKALEVRVNTSTPALTVTADAKTAFGSDITTAGIAYASGGNSGQWNTAYTTANAALPKTGGAMTGAITTNSTFDGVDVGARDAVLTSTKTTAEYQYRRLFYVRGYSIRQGFCWCCTYH